MMLQYTSIVYIHYTEDLKKDQKGKLFLHSRIQQPSVAETCPSISNCHTLIVSFIDLGIVKPGTALNEIERTIAEVTQLPGGEFHSAPEYFSAGSDT